MSKEQDFHRLIEQQDEERKDNIWKKINSQTDSEKDEVVSNSDNTLALAKSLNMNKKSIMIMSAVLLLVVVLIIVTAVIIPKQKNGGDRLRYCDADDYYMSTSDLNLDQYANQNSLDILYFDWYEQV